MTNESSCATMEPRDRRVTPHHTLSLCRRILDPLTPENPEQRWTNLSHVVSRRPYKKRKLSHAKKPRMTPRNTIQDVRNSPTSVCVQDQWMYLFAPPPITSEC
ncbi:hypothetical protein GW17_00000496 [Ensete ventricosum]|nr:hypothetical protein GW17_00000496 [Ensete ventricosum]